MTSSTTEQRTTLAGTASRGSASTDTATRDTAGPGRTSVADVVVSKIAGLAAAEISGVYALGGGAARAFGALRERIPGATSNVAQGVAVEVGERQTAVDLTIVVEYGVPITDVARSIRRNVIHGIERMTGLEVVEVNIEVVDVHLPDEGDQHQPAEQPPRVA